MAFHRILSTNTTIYCIRSCYRSPHYLKCISNSYLSSNSKRFHSLFTKNSNCLIGVKLVSRNTSYRTLSSFKSDSTLTFSPSPDAKPSGSAVDTDVLDLSNFVVPEAPNPLEETISQTLINNVDIPITALNLGSNYTPVGWVLHALEFLHTTFPWWATIAVATLTLRICMFPLVIKAQRNAMKMNAILPEMQLLQEKATQARLTGNSLEFAKYTVQNQELFKKHGISPFKSLLVPLAQAPAFISFFVTLRRMANLPVESLKMGGILWFVDLSVPDPYFLLPILTSVSLWAALELGVESGVNASSSVIMKTTMRVIPCVTLLFIWNFPTAILMYWCTSNIISLLQVALLKQTSVRSFLNIPKPIKYSKEQLPASQKGFVQTIKESLDNSKIQRKLEERKRLDDMNFKKAAIGPIKKTYKYDPTKVEKHN